MTDSFSLSAGDGSTSENMKWDGLNSILIGVGVDIHAFKNYTFSASWTPAFRFGGEVDASVDEPTSPYTDLSADGENGDFQNINLSAAYNKTYASGLIFSQRIGYRQSIQSYYLINPNVTAPTANSASEQLNSSLDTTWTGPYLGLVVQKQFSESITWQASADVSFLVYEADGHLNLRPDLAQPRSMSQSGDGIGFDLDFAVKWQWMEKWLIHGSVHYTQWSISGHDVRYPAIGGSVVRTLNDATYNSLILGGAVSYVF
ncbi:MAG: hypothetical protein HRU15_10350 [Planctomycetes bacterium]|nr:hypothetical protein [Planctomycetota bacterium]